MQSIREVASAITSIVRAFGTMSLSATRMPRNKHTTRPPHTRHLRSIGAAALVGCAVVLLSGAAARAAIATSATLTSTPNPSVSGEQVTFTATITATGGATPIGSVIFFDNQNSTQLGIVMLTAGSGGVAMLTSSLNGVVTTHDVQATFIDPSNTFAQSNTAHVSQVVNAGVKTTTNLQSSANPSQVNQPVTFTATVTGSGGTPTGTVTFTRDLGNVTTVPLVNGVATLTITFPAATTSSIFATYNADNTFATSTSNTINQQVLNGKASTTNLSSSVNPSLVNQSVTFTATVTGSGGTPTGNLTFDVDLGGTVQTVGLVNGQAAFTIVFPKAGTHSVFATYAGDSTFAPSNSNTINQQVVNGTTTVTLSASPNPSAPNQAVTFTATVKVASGTGTPSGTVMFQDNGTTIGTGTLAPASGFQTATFTTSALTNGNHPITAVYSGDANFAGNTSAVLNQNVGTGASDSVKLHQMQISTTPVIAAAWGATTSSAMDDAVSAGFGGNPQSLSPAGTGFTYYFNDDAPAQPTSNADQDSLRRYLASPNGSWSPPNGNSTDARSAAANDSVKRVDDDFKALGYAGGMPTKAPPPPSATPHDWLAWVTVRGTDYWRGTFGSDLKGDQVDVLAGLTRRVSKDFVVGAFGGYEHFDYTSQAFTAHLKGDGWTVGAYLGWKLAPNLRFDAGGAWSDIMANDTAGAANGNFTGTRWLINGGLTGTYPWQMLVLEPSARVYALWEHENAFTDSLGTLQAARNFETGRASAGVKAIYPFAWTSSTVALSPYAGLYADYYFSRDDAQTAGLTTVPLLQGFSARLTGGVAASFAGGATLGAGGEFGGIGSATHIWTWTARGRIPF